MIELIENINERKINTKLLLAYGSKIVKYLQLDGNDVYLFYTRDDTSDFLHNYSDFFEMITEDNGEEYISLKEGKDSKNLRDYFRANMTLDMLLACVHQESLEVLLSAS